MNYSLNLSDWVRFVGANAQRLGYVFHSPRELLNAALSKRQRMTGCTAGPTLADAGLAEEEFARLAGVGCAVAVVAPVAVPEAAPAPTASVGAKVGHGALLVGVLGVSVVAAPIMATVSTVACVGLVVTGALGLIVTVFTSNRKG